MTRRRLLATAGIALGALLLGGHTPYGQWVVYRKKHLLIGCHRADPDTYTLAKGVVAELDLHLPEARARVARAPTAGRLASLLGTGQLEIAILSPADGQDMAAGAGPFKPYGPIPLRLLAQLGDHLLTVHSNFSPSHAWLVSDAVLNSRLSNSPSADEVPPLPWHAGTRLRILGEPLPN